MKNKFFKTYEETKNWLDKMWVKNYKIDKETLIVDVDGKVILSKKGLDYLPVQFGKVGLIDVSDNSFSNFNGFPKVVKIVYANDNRIDSFVGLPEGVKVVWALNNQISSFVGLPESVEEVYVDNNLINSFDGLPEGVSRVVTCKNLISSFVGLPVSVERLWVVDNPLREYRPDHIKYYMGPSNNEIDANRAAHEKAEMLKAIKIPESINKKARMF